MDCYRVAWACLIAALAPLAAGCAADELDPRDAAYPEPIGVTLPGATAPSSAEGRAVRDPPPVASAPSSDVVIGDANGGDAPEDGAVAQGFSPNSGDSPVAGPFGDGPPGDGAPPEGYPGEGPPEQGPPGEGPAAGAVAGDQYPDADPSALSDFRPSLDPYGTWTDDATYGSVWVPSPDVVGDDFTPYVSGGHWAYDDDYVWVSDYDWGWVPFHYGRWARGERAGWEWIPGRRYAGAWVSWRYGGGGDGYVGWAPLAPTWGWRGGAAVGLRHTRPEPYAFVGARDLFARSVGEHVIGGAPGRALMVRTRPWRSASAAAGRPLDGRWATGGPAPAVLGIAPSAIVHTTVRDRGVLQARAFARPSSAVALGGHAPLGGGWGGAGRYGAAVRRPSTTLGGGTTADRSSYPSHFGGRFGVGFTGSPNAAGPLRSPVVLQGRPYFGARESSSAYGARPTALPATRAPVARGYEGARFPGAPPARSSGSRPTSGSSGWHGGGGGRGGGGRGGRR